MLKLMHRYLIFICNQALSMSDILNRAYNENLSRNKLFDTDKYYDFYVNKYKKVLEDSISGFVHGRDFFEGYDELNQLSKYIWRALQYATQQDIILNNSHILLPQHSDYIEAGSVITGIHIDSISKQCILDISHLTAYGAGRINKNIKVDSINAKMIFKNISNIVIMGNLCAYMQSLQMIQESFFSCESKNTICYSLLCFTLPPHIFLMDIMFTELFIEAEKSLVI